MSRKKRRNENVFKYQPAKKRKNRKELKKAIKIIIFILIIIAIGVGGYFAAEPIGTYLFEFIQKIFK